MENQEQENKVNNEDEKCNKNSKKMLNIIYLIIFLSIAIGIAFYINQNKSNLIKVDEKENNQLEEKNISNSGANNIVIDEISNNSTGTSANTETKIDTGVNTNVSGSINSTGTLKTDEDKKNEEAIIKDFEKELDSLFDVIDQNAK